jgi:hypothetical protein
MKVGGPKKEATGDHDDFAPPDCEILELLDEIEPSILWWLPKQPIGMLLEELLENALLVYPTSSAKVVSKRFERIRHVLKLRH